MVWSVVVRPLHAKSRALRCVSISVVLVITATFTLTLFVRFVVKTSFTPCTTPYHWHTQTAELMQRPGVTIISSTTPNFQATRN